MKKVSEERFKKVKERQVRKCNSLVNKTINRNNGNSGIDSTTGRNHNNRSDPNNQGQSVTNNNQAGNGNNNNNNGNNNKWVINLSKTSLTKAQESLLAKGSNFALAPSNIPSTDYITAIE